MTCERIPYEDAKICFLIKLPEVFLVEPSGVQCFDESNPLKDDEASAFLDAAVLV